MTIYYIDPVGGTNSGTNSTSNPWATFQYTYDTAPLVDGDEVRIAHTGTPTDVSITGVAVWTRGEKTIVVDGDITASVAAGNIIGRKDSKLDGTKGTANEADGGYRVTSAVYSGGTLKTTISIDQRYAGASGSTDDEIRIFPSVLWSDTYHIRCSKNLTISGAWNPATFATQESDKFTLITRASRTSPTSSRGLVVNPNGAAYISRINLDYSYYSFYPTAGSGHVVENCSFISSAVYSAYVKVQNPIEIINCAFLGNNGASWPTFYSTSPKTSMDFSSGKSVVAGYRGNGRVFAISNTAGGEYDLTGLEIVGGYYGVVPSGNDIIYKNLVVDYMRYSAVYLGSIRNTGFVNCTFNNSGGYTGTYLGIKFAVQNTGNFIKNCNFNDLPRAIDMAQTTGTIPHVIYY
jgi:hypothetical protein